MYWIELNQIELLYWMKYFTSAAWLTPSRTWNEISLRASVNHCSQYKIQMVIAACRQWLRRSAINSWRSHQPQHKFIWFNSFYELQSMNFMRERLFINCWFMIEWNWLHEIQFMHQLNSMAQRHRRHALYLIFILSFSGAGAFIDFINEKLVAGWMVCKDWFQFQFH